MPSDPIPRRAAWRERWLRRSAGSAYEDAARRLHEKAMEYAAATKGQGEEARRHIHGESEKVVREIRQKEESLGRAMQSMVEKIKREVGTALHMKWEEMKVGLRSEISEEVERRVALSNQQSEGELMTVKN